MKLVDTSVIVAGAQDWNPANPVALSALGSCRRAISHTLLEAYSVLTRSPRPFRIDGALANAWLTTQFTSEVSLPENSHLSSLATLHELGVSGGAVYDGLVALTALHHRATLLSLDKRAATTYLRVGAKFELLR